MNGMFRDYSSLTSLNTKVKDYCCNRKINKII